MNTTWVDPFLAYGVPPENHSHESLVGSGSVIIFPEKLKMLGWSRLDSMAYVSVALEMHDRSVVCAGAQIIGGGDRKVTLGRWSYVGWQSIVMARSEKYDRLVGVGFGAPGPCVEGDVEFKPFSGIAARCEVLPGITLPEGAVVGMGSMVHPKHPLRPWWIHLGRPAKPWKPRDRDRILREAEQAEGRKA